MKAFGYPEKKTKSGPWEMREVTFVADPEMIRRLADFLEDAAARMESDGDRFDHLHLLDVWSAWGRGLPDVIVARPADAA